MHLTSLDFVVAVGDNRAPPHQCAFIAFVYAILHWFTYLSLSFSFGNRNRDTSELYVVLWHPIAAHILPPRLVGWASAIVSWSVQPPDGVTGALISVIPPSAMSYLYIVFGSTTMSCCNEQYKGREAEDGQERWHGCSLTTASIQLRTRPIGSNDWRGIDVDDLFGLIVITDTGRGHDLPSNEGIGSYYTGMDITCVYTSFYGFICVALTQGIHVTSRRT